MKKALVSYQGTVGKIVNPGEEGPIYEGPDATIAWVDAPDQVQLDWTLEWSPSQEIMVWVERDGPPSDNGVARRVAYGELGAQLGMIFDDIKANGKLDQTSDWYQHQVLVKSMIPKPTPIPYYETLEDMVAEQMNREPAADKSPVHSTAELQSWKRYPGWSGYDGPKLEVPAGAKMNDNGWLYSAEGEKLHIASYYGIVSETALDGTITWYDIHENIVPKV